MLLCWVPLMAACCPMRSTPGLDPEEPFANDCSGEFQLALLLRGGLARFLELLPVRCVLERLVVLRERLFRLTLLHEHIAPCFQRIGPMRTAPVRVLELSLRVREIAVLQEGDAPGVVRRGQVRRERDGLGVRLLCPGA